MVIDFTLDASANRKAQEADLALAEESALRYDLLLGDILLKTPDCDLSAKWGWIPIVDFAFCLNQISQELAQEDAIESIFDFTDSDATIIFRKENDWVLIKASYAECEARVSLNEFITAVRQFIHKVAVDLPAQYPQLAQNAEFLRLVPRAGTD